MSKEKPTVIENCIREAKEQYGTIINDYGFEVINYPKE